MEKLRRQQDISQHCIYIYYSCLTLEKKRKNCVTITDLSPEVHIYAGSLDSCVGEVLHGVTQLDKKKIITNLLFFIDWIFGNIEDEVYETELNYFWDVCNSFRLKKYISKCCTYT